MEEMTTGICSKLIELNKLSLEKGFDGNEEEDLLETHKYGGGNISR